MASQMVATSGNKRLRANQTAALNSRLRYLPQIMAQKKMGIQRREDLTFRNRQFAQSAQQQKDTMAAQNKAQRMAAGVSAANLGMSVSGMSKNAGPGATVGKSLGSSTLGGGSLGSMFGDFTIGQGVSSGLAGFAGSMFGGDSKFKKTAYGMGAGALMGLMGGSGSSIGSGLGGAVFGGLGSLFG